MWLAYNVKTILRTPGRSSLTSHEAQHLEWILTHQDLDTYMYLREGCRTERLARHHGGEKT